MRTFRLLAVVGVVVVAASLACNNPEGDKGGTGAGTEEDAAGLDRNDATTVKFPLKGSVGDKNYDGINLSTEFVPGAALKDPTKLNLYVIVKKDGVPKSHFICELSEKIVEVQMISKDEVQIDTMSVSKHFTPLPESFDVQSATDFKVSRKFPEPAPAGGKWIIGTEDGRPAIQEAFSLTDINFVKDKPAKRVRISFKSVNLNKGNVLISSENTPVGKSPKDCLYKTTGIDDKGWGKDFKKPCPNND